MQSVTHRGEELVGKVGVFCQYVRRQVEVLSEREVESSRDINTVLMKTPTALSAFSSFH